MKHCREKELLEARVLDWFHTAQYQGRPKFSSFFSEEEILYIQRMIKREKWENYLFWGGHDFCRRKMLGVFPEEMEPGRRLFPLVSLKFFFEKSKICSHRDVLGALMSLQIQRESIGDIFIGEGCATLFLRNSVAPLIKDQLRKIRNFSVQMEDGICSESITPPSFKEISGTVSSLRLDAVICVAIGASRKEASMLIQKGTVIVNGETAVLNRTTLQIDDKFTIRGYGKFIFKGCLKQTRKGRLLIRIDQYL